MDTNQLDGKNILITGAARRIGRHFALELAKMGANVIIHYGRSAQEARQLVDEINAWGRTAWMLSADLDDIDQVKTIIPQSLEFGNLYALVNNAAVFTPMTFQNTSIEAWQSHIMINLTAPFLLSQDFDRYLSKEEEGRIINILDWRALRPGSDHFPYTLSKAALASLTKMLAVAMAPRVTVNGLALGAVLPPDDNPNLKSIISRVPIGRWANLDEASQALIFLLAGPKYITGEIIHVDGGRNLV
jgi:NAD(P)-dependent dehydrogenase (short-subunit alcohol dehydrogenase family)